MKLLSQANPPSAAQKNNLVFYGLAPEPLEVQVSREQVQVLLEQVQISLEKV
jgi:hypothetical protein